MPACTAPACDRPAIARGLCAAHYRQHLRGQPLRALKGPRGRVRPGIEHLCRLEVRLSPETLAALLEAGRSAGVSSAHAASLVLEEWAASRRAGLDSPL
jgi:hypothetical protein